MSEALHISQQTVFRIINWVIIYLLSFFLVIIEIDHSYLYEYRLNCVKLIIYYQYVIYFLDRSTDR